MPFGGVGKERLLPGRSESTPGYLRRALQGSRDGISGSGTGLCKGLEWKAQAGRGVKTLRLGEASDGCRSQGYGALAAKGGVYPIRPREGPEGASWTGRAWELRLGEGGKTNLCLD